MNKVLAFGLLLVFVSIEKITWGQTAIFTANQTEGCDYLIVQFDASASTGNPPLTYHWDFGNGNQTTITENTASAIYNTIGNYSAVLVVEDGNGNNSTPYSVSINVNDGPEADFAAVGNTTGCSPLTLQFNDGSTPGSSNIVEWFWEFGDGSTSTQQNPVKTYTTPGDFTVNLQVTDDNGCTANKEVDNLVTSSGEIRFDIEGDITYSCDTNSSLTTTFSPGLRYGTDTDLYNFHWDFGDGNTSNLTNPTHTFSKGAYDVSLRISTKDGICSVEKTFPRFINVGPANASITYTSTYPSCGVPRFRFEIHDFGVADNQDIRWDLGDGTIITRTGKSSYTHLYASPGTYQVSAFIPDPNNAACVSVATTTASITFPGHEFTADNPVNCNMVPITFTPPNLWNARSYIWQFGDGTTSHEEEPVKTYSEEGTYDVTLTIVIGKEEACLLTLKQEDFVHIGKPSGTLISDGREVLYDAPVGYDLSGLSTGYLQGGCLTDPVNFNVDGIKGDIEKYTWIFGDGAVEETDVPTNTHQYTAEGEFSPAVILTDAQGCTDTVSCEDCVLRGEKRVPDVLITNVLGDTINHVGDTVCCTYWANFYNQTNAAGIDLAWYHVKLIGEDAGLPPMYMGYYKEGNQFYNTSGVPVTELNWEPFFLTSYSYPVDGDDPDLNYHVFNKGCPSKIEYPKFQHHRLPWGNFLYTPPICEVNVDPSSDKIIFDLNDPAVFQGEWLAEQNYPLDSVVIIIDPPFDSTVTYRRSDYPGGLNFPWFQANNEFPVIVLDSSASGQFFVHTYLYDSNPLNPGGFTKPPAATDACGPPGAACYDRVPVPIVKSGLRVNVETVSSVKSGCAPLTVNFSLQDKFVVKADSSFTWIFSNGQIARGTNPEVIFTEPGNITYHVSGYDSSGCTIDSLFMYDTIQVNGIYVSFDVDSTALCLTDTNFSDVNITNHSYSTGNIIENKWNFAGHEELIMDSTSFNYVFPPGSAPPLHLQFLPKYISLTVTDDGGCKASDSVAVYLRKPAADVGFALMDSGSCSPWAWMDLDEYEFVGGVPPIYGDLFWKFDSDSIYNSKSLFDPHGTQIFSKGNPGSLNAYVKITGDSMGTCPAVSRDTTFEFVVNNIKAGFAISDTLFECAPATVSFTDSTTVLIGDSIPIEEWNWTLYNESGAVVRTSVLKNPIFQLDDPGYYTLEMRVTDENGCEGIVVSDSVLLIDSSRVQIILPNDTICSGEALEYKGVVGDGYSYTWDFGDGAVYDEEVLNYTFHQPGMKVVRLIVLDCDDTPYLDTIFVKPSPVLGLNDTTVCLGDTARLNAPVLQGYSYLWEPTGSTAPGYSTTMPGILFLTVEDTVLGCSSKDTIEVSNYDLPRVNIVSPDVVCKGQAVQLHQSSGAEVVSYQWFDGSIVFSTIESPSLLIDSTKSITLLVTDTRGCENTTSGTIEAMEEPAIDLQDVVLCKGDSTIVSAKPLNQEYPEYHYTWWIDGENLPDTTSTISVNDEGEYTLHLDVGACGLSDTFYLRVNPKPDITQNSDGVVFCEEMTDVELDAGEATGYWWYHSHEKTRRVYVHSQDTFVVQLTNKYNCSIDDTIITYNRCEPKILTPNAFIPGKTGDEKFYVHAYNVENFNMIIFNRWGEIIFETKDPENAWDGTYQGEPMPAGVYPWVVKYTGDNPDHEHLQQKTGMVTLIR